MSTYARRQNLRRWEEYRHRDGYEIPLSELEVDRDCAICFKGREWIVPEEQIQLLSPNGVVHQGEDFGMTACGKDATGEGWWWRL